MNGCISLNLRIEYIEVHDLKGKKNSRTDIVGYRYNPNLPNIEISLIYYNIPCTHSGSVADGETGEKSVS